MVHNYIDDQPEKFSKDERIINGIECLMDGHAVSWHIQWFNGTLNDLHPKSKAGYVNALKLRFEHKDTKDEADTQLERSIMRVAYEICSARFKPLMTRRWLLVRLWRA